MKVTSNPLTISSLIIKVAVVVICSSQKSMTLSPISDSDTSIECGVQVGERVTRHTSKNQESRHRRMVSLNDFTPSCQRSNVITVQFPQDAIKRSFQKVDTSKPLGSILPLLSVSLESSMPSRYSYWAGEDLTDGSTFDFVQDEDGNMAGSMVDMTNHNVLQFHNQNGSYVVTITNSNDFPPEDHEPVHTVFDRKLHQSPGESTTISVPSRRAAISSPLEQNYDNKLISRNLYDDNGGNLDVMVVWTKLAECEAYGLASGCTLTTQTEANMMALINLAIQETNDAYQASGVNTQLLLVHAYRHPTYVEESFKSTLSDLRKGNLPGVHSNRETYGADIVAMLIDNFQYCGIAFIGPYKSHMYSVIAWNCATGYYSFGHEIGHNLGLRHDRGMESACSGGGYNYGYRDPDAKFRTILAYDCKYGKCDNILSKKCVRIKRFSNPTFTYRGRALGSAREDCARAINDVREEVAGYYTHVSSLTPMPTTLAPTTLTPTTLTPTTLTPTTLTPTTLTPTTLTPTTLTPTTLTPTTLTPTTLMPTTLTPTTLTPTTLTPTTLTSPFPTPATPTSICSDSPLRFKIIKNGTIIIRSCSWVANKDVNNRCSYEGVASMCQKTCDFCYTCIDGKIKFKLVWNGRNIARDCRWVANKATKQRCAVDGVSETCRKTCGFC